MNPAATAGIRRYSARLRTILTAVIVLLGLLLLLERFGAAGLRVATQVGDAAALRALAAQAVAALPELAYLLALLGVRQALGEFARGELYAPVVAALLHRVGVLLAAGTVLAVCLVPGLQRLLGAGPGWWIAFDVSSVALGALGLSLTAVARVLSRAAALQAELDEIF